MLRLVCHNPTGIGGINGLSCSLLSVNFIPFLILSNTTAFSVSLTLNFLLWAETHFAFHSLFPCHFTLQCVNKSQTSVW